MNLLGCIETLRAHGYSKIILVKPDPRTYWRCQDQEKAITPSSRPYKVSITVMTQPHQPIT